MYVDCFMIIIIIIILIIVTVVVSDLDAFMWLVSSCLLLVGCSRSRCAVRK